MPAATPFPRSPPVLILGSAENLLSGPGCAVCRYTAEARDRYLGWFALEAHADPVTITRLCGSLGMCPRHTRALMSQPGRLSGSPPCTRTCCKRRGRSSARGLGSWHPARRASMTRPRPTARWTSFLTG